jgi:hypothetical protein
MSTNTHLSSGIIIIIWGDNITSHGKCSRFIILATRLWKWPHPTFSRQFTAATIRTIIIRYITAATKKTKNVRSYLRWELHPWHDEDVKYSTKPCRHVWDGEGPFPLSCLHGYEELQPMRYSIRTYKNLFIFPFLGADEFCIFDSCFWLDDKSPMPPFIIQTA